MNSVSRVRGDVRLFLKVKELVDKHGWTQRKAAEFCGVKEKAYSAWKIREESKGKTKEENKEKIVVGSNKQCPFRGMVRHRTNCLGAPFRVYKHEDIIIDSSRVIKMFDDDLKISGLLPHQLTAGIISEYYTLRSNITPETVRRIRYVASHGVRRNKK
jgi:hypothetical protein